MNEPAGARPAGAVLVVGATGRLGRAIARHLLEGGHHVQGLARSEAGAQRLVEIGVEPLRGDLDAGRPAVVAAARRAAAVVYAAQVDPGVEVAVVEDLLGAVTSTGAPFVFTSGSGVLLQRTGGAWSSDSFAEDDTFVVEPLATARLAAEAAVRRAAGLGARAVVVRPGMVWGPGAHGHLQMVERSVELTGSACYVGAGLNTYAHVHLDDVGRLFGLALEHGRGGSTYHATAGETPVRWIAERVAAVRGVATRSLTMNEAVDVWGEFAALLISASSRLRDARTRQELGWRPDHLDMLSSARRVHGEAGLSRVHSRDTSGQ